MTQKTLVEYGFGKVPDKLEAEGLPDRVTLVLHYAHERPVEAIEVPPKRKALPDAIDAEPVDLSMQAIIRRD